MNDIYPPQTLPELLADLTCLVRRQLAAGKTMSLDSLAGFHAKLRDAHRMALEGAQPLDAVAYAKVGQIGLRADEPIGPKMGELVDLREALTSQQRAIQADLDAEDAGELAHPAAKGRAEAAHRRGEVVILPVSYRTHDGGDAA